VTYPPPAPYATARWIGCLAVLFCGIGGLVFATLHTHGESLLVVEHDWNRKIYVEQFKTCREQGTSVPAGGRKLRSWTYVSGHVMIGKVSVPLHGTKYEWDIDRWVIAYYLHTSGKTVATSWPDITKLRTGTALGCERPGVKEETYWLFVRNEEEKGYTYTMPEADWLKVNDNERVVGHVNHFGTLRSIDRVEADQ
jgi:hypothetical protein